MEKFLNQDGLQYFTERLVALIEQKTQINIVGTIDENSTNQQIPGAKAVYDLLTSMVANITTIRMVVVPSLPANGEANVFYLIQVDDDTYRQYIYVDGQWFDLGTTEIDLSGYWAKDELVALTNAEIQGIIDDVMGV